MAVFAVLWRVSARRDENMLKKVSPVVLIAFGLLALAFVAFVADIQQLGNAASSLAAILLLVDQLRRPSP